MKTKEFKRFIGKYNESLEELLKDKKLIERQFLSYTKAQLGKGGLEKWKVKLLNIGED